MRGGSAGSYDGEVRSGHAVHDAYIAGSHVNNAAGNKERRYFSRATGEKLVVIVLYGGKPANSGAHGDTDPVTVVLCYLEPRIFDRLDTGRDTVVHEDVHAPRVAWRDVIGDIEIADGSGDLCRKPADVEVIDPGYAGPTFADIAPGSIDIVADRGQDAHAGDYDASVAQGITRIAAAELPILRNVFRNRRSGRPLRRAS